MLLFIYNSNIKKILKTNNVTNIYIIYSQKDTQINKQMNPVETVVSNYRYVIQFSAYVDDSDFEKVKAILPTIEDTTAMKPIFEALDGTVEYGVIRLSLTFINM